MMSGRLARLLLLCCLVVQTVLTPLAITGAAPAVAASAPGARTQTATSLPSVASPGSFGVRRPAAACGRA